MKKSFVYKDDKSDKYWEIELKGKSYTTYYGKTGSKPRSDTNTFDSIDEAKKEYEKVINQKLKKGYVEKSESDEAKAFNEDELKKLLDKRENASVYEEKMSLEREIIKNFGVEGIKELYSSGTKKIFSLEDAPPSFPWKDQAGKEPREIIQSTIGKLKDTYLKHFIKELEDLCFLVVGMKKSNKFYLVYCTEAYDYKKNKRVALFVGGEPNPSPEVSKQAKNVGWKMPKPLAKFYSVHDGFSGGIGFVDSPSSPEGLMPSHNLVSMGKLMNPIVKEGGYKPEGYEFDNLLEFSSDGSGNCQSFYRKDKNTEATMTVDWDHEGWVISEERDFFDYLNEKFMFAIYEE